MSKKPKDDADFDAAKGKAQTGIAELIGECGYEPTMAACAEFVTGEITEDMRKQYRSGDE